MGERYFDRLIHFLDGFRQLPRNSGYGSGIEPVAVLVDTRVFSKVIEELERAGRSFEERQDKLIELAQLNNKAAEIFGSPRFAVQVPSMNGKWKDEYWDSSFTSAFSAAFTLNGKWRIAAQIQKKRKVIFTWNL